jgi:TetR/AcrR family transcriptional regulator
MTGEPPYGNLPPPVHDGRKADSERTKAAILAAARTEFAQNGYAGARVDEIADRANVNKHVIYYHFDSKDGLFKSALELCYQEMLGNNLAYLASVSESAPLDALSNLIRHLFDRISGHREVVALILEENRHEGRHVRDSVLPNRSVLPLLQFLKRTFDAGERAGEFRKHIDTEQFFLDIISMCMFYFMNIHTISAVLMADQSDAVATSRRREHVVQSLIAGISI